MPQDAHKIDSWKGSGKESMSVLDNNVGCVPKRSSVRERSCVCERLCS